LNFFDGFSKNTQVSNFMKIRLAKAELINADRRVDGQTDMTMPIVAFRNFLKAPKKANGVGINPRNLDIRFTISALCP
jgi:hypothetical protein